MTNMADLWHTPSVLNHWASGLEARRSTATKAAVTAQGTRLFRLRPKFLAARTGGRKLCRFTQVLPGLPTCSSRRHPSGVAAVSANSCTWGRPC